MLLFLMFTLLTMFTGNVYKFAMFTGKHLCWSLFLINSGIQVSNFIKKTTATQVLSCEYCKIFKYSLFYRPPPMAAFASWKKNNLQSSYSGLLKLWQCIYFCTGLKIIFLSPDRFSGRTDVTSNKVNFRPDIKQTFFLKKIRIPRVCVALKVTWSYWTLISIKLR